MKIDAKTLYSYTLFFNILYVENDENLRESTKNILQPYFKHLDIAVDGADGLKKYKQFKDTHTQPYDLVITDIQMPNMDGITMSEQIFEIEPEQSIIILTAHNTNDYFQSAINIGISGFVTKPINKSKFNKILFKITQTITNKLLNKEYINTIQQLNLELDEKNLILDRQREVQVKNSLLKVEEIKQAFDNHSVVVVTDTKGTIASVNNKFCDISGYSKEELLGNNHRLIDLCKHSKDFWTNMYKTIDSGKEWTAEVSHIAKNGCEYWFDTTIVPFYNTQNKIESYVAIGTDITSKKKLEFSLLKAKELAQESVRAKSNFLASIIEALNDTDIGHIKVLDSDRTDEELELLLSRYLNINNRR